MKKTICLFLLLFCVCGCWNYKELDDYSIVTGIAIDKNEDEFELSVLISNAKKSSDGSSNSSSNGSVVYSGKGSSIFSALKDISRISPKELYLDHFTILVISEEIATNGLYNTIDFFLRYPMVRKDFSIAISKDCKAKDTLKIITPLTDYPSQSLADNLQFTSELQGLIINLNYNELVYDLIAPGKEITMTSINLIGDAEKGSSKENIETSEPNTYLKLGNIAAFKDDKLVSFATEEESLGINIINGHTTEMYVKTKIDDGYVISNTVEFSNKVNVEIKDNKPIFSISVSGNAKIMEVNGKINLHDNNVIKKIEKKLNKKLEDYINKGLEFAIRNETDIFGFGNLLHKNYPNFYEKVVNSWNENLKDLDINIKSDWIIKSISSSQNSVEVLNDKK